MKEKTYTPGKQGKDIPRLNGTLRAHSLQVPESVWRAPGMVVLGRRIK